MKILLKLALLVGMNAVALWAAQRLVPGIIFTDENYLNFIKAGAILGLINTFLAPLVKLVALPLRLLTLGLFTVIINVAMLFLVARFFDFFTIESLMAGVWGVVVISLVNYVISAVLKDK